MAEHDILKRSSHAVAAVDGELFVFGGELVAREPRDGDVHVVGVRAGEIDNRVCLSRYKNIIANKFRLQTRKPHHGPLALLPMAQRHVSAPQWSP